MLHLENVRTFGSGDDDGDYHENGDEEDNDIDSIVIGDCRLVEFVKYRIRSNNNLMMRRVGLSR